MAAEKMIPLTPMPSAPQQKVDPPAVFSDKAEVYVAAQVKLVDEINSKIIPAHNSLVNPANQVLAALPAILVAPDKAEQATLAAQEAGVSRAAALASKNAASAAEANARACEAISVSSKDIAVAKANEASASATVASAAEAISVSSKDIAVTKANEASVSAFAAAESEVNAFASETAAQGSKIAAQAAQTGAEKARDEAQVIAGGDYVTRNTEQVITGKKTFSAGLIGDLEGNAGTATRAQSAAQADAVPWAGVTDKPATFPPATHGHGWDEVSGKPPTFTPSSHSHPAADISGTLPTSKGGTGNTSGNAPTATKWQAKRTITLTGAASGSVSLDGSGNVSLPVSLNGGNSPMMPTADTFVWLRGSANYVNSHSRIYLPPGGTWAYVLMVPLSIVTSSDAGGRYRGYYSQSHPDYPIYIKTYEDSSPVGVAAGGTYVGRNNYSVLYVGFAWRIA